MYEFLIDHALKNVWCNPRLDNQYMLAPKRITPPQGALNRFTVMDNPVHFPVQRQRYHVYVVGQIDPWVLGLLRQVPAWQTNRWYTFAEASNHAKLLVNIFNANGVNLPRTKCLYMFMDQNTLIFAVPMDGRFKVRWTEEQLFFRFYSGSYFRQPNATLRKLKVDARTPANNNDILAVEQLVLQAKAQYANVMTYVNGVFVDRPNLGDTQIGDLVEWVADDAVVRSVQWPVSSLKKFNSEVDSVFKYLLSHDQDVESIEYLDDIDIHVVHRPEAGFAKGLYLNRLYFSHIRMLTHRDYSIPTHLVEVIRNELEAILGVEISDSSRLSVEMVVRKSDAEKPLVFENQRIFELYKLPYQKRLDAMVGLNSEVTEWSAVNLEFCGYTRVMGMNYTDFNIQSVEEAYGYNAVAKILADTPTKTHLNSGRQRAALPYGLQKNSTFYEYDADGIFLGWKQHINDNDYEADSNDCRLIEGVVGLGGDYTDTVYGQDNLEVPTDGTGYCVYRCYLVQGVPTNNWEDITGSSEYEITDGTLTWSMGGNDHWLAVRTDRRFISYDTEIEMNDGLLNFTIMEKIGSDPLAERVPMTIPMSQVDITLNGFSLIRDVDYYIQFPQVFITNRLYLQQPVEEVTQRVHVRCRSLPAQDMSLDPIEQRGWVLHNMLSGNQKYDLRDDKVWQIIVGGRQLHRDDILFAEDRPSANVLGELNGLPYQIKDLIVPMWNFTARTTNEMRSASQVIDASVSAYMTEYFGPMEPTDLAAIPQRYPVVSPFLSHILYLLRNGGIVVPVDRLPTPQEMLNLCGPYENLLSFDPLSDVQLDDKFTYVIPHMNDGAYELEYQAYRFYQAVVKHYAQDRVDFSQYVTLTTY